MPQNKRKILFVITQGTWGGAQKYVFDLSEGLCGDFEVHVAVGSPEGEKDLQKRIFSLEKDIVVHTLHKLTRPIAPLKDISSILELSQLYRRIQPDIVHLNSSKAGVVGSLAAQLLPKRKRPPLVYTAHGWVFHEPLSWWRTWLYTALERTNARLADTTITLSAHDAKAAQEVLGLSKPQLHTIPLAVDPPHVVLSQSEARTFLSGYLQSAVPQDAPWVGCIANHYKTKGLPHLLRAWKELQADHPHAHLLLIGDGPERNKLEALIETHHIQRVHLLGAVPKAAALLPAFDFLVIPSVKEGLPYVLLEAQAAQTPLIATRVGGIPEYIMHMKSGLLCDPARPDQLQKHISWALSHPAEMSSFANAASTTARSKASMVKDTIARYLLLPHLE